MAHTPGHTARFTGGLQTTEEILADDTKVASLRRPASQNRTTVTQIPIPGLTRTKTGAPITFGIPSTFGADFIPEGEAGVTAPAPRIGFGSALPGSAPTVSAATSAPVDVGFEQFARANQGVPAGGGEISLTGPRIIRREGETPILTNLTGPALEAGLTEGRSFARGDTTGRTIVLDPETLAEEGRSGFDLARLVGEGTTVPERGFGPVVRTAEEEILQGLEGVVRTIGSPRARTGSTPLGAATAVGFERARLTAEAGAQERTFEQDAATQELGFRGREVGATERRAGAAEVTADTNRINALTNLQKSIDKGTELGDFKLTASRPDPTSLDPTNPTLLPATVKIGDTEFNISPEEEQAISTRTREMLRLITADPETAGVSQEEAFNKALRTATLDVIGDRQ